MIADGNALPDIHQPKSEVGRIRKEARSLMNGSLLAAEQHYAAETPYYWMRDWIGGIAAASTAVASAVAFKQAYNGRLAGYISACVFVLSAILAFLKPGTKAEVHHRCAKGYEGLYNEAGYFYRVESCSQAATAKALEKRLRQLTNKSNELKRNSPPIGGYAYSSAAKHIKKGGGEVIRIQEQEYEKDDSETTVRGL